MTAVPNNERNELPHNGSARKPLTAQRALVDARHQRRARGGDRCRFEIGHVLEESRPDVSLLAYDETADAFPTAAAAGRLQITERRPWQHLRGDVFEHLSIPRMCRMLGVHVYHGTFQTLPSLPGFKAAERTVVSVHDVALFAFPEAYSRRFGILGRRMLARSVHNADVIVAITRTTADDLIKLFPLASKKTTVILNGVSEMFHAIATRDRSMSQAQVAAILGSDRPFVLFVGNVEPKKNLLRLGKAFQSLAALHPGHRLVIVGERPAELPSDGTEQLVNDPNIVFTGYLPDEHLPALYQAAECLAFPSLYEGFGMPVIEAMAVGTPVVTSTMSCLPEVAGGAAELVDPYDIADIARGLTRALRDSAWRNNAIAAGFERARGLTWRENVRQITSIYDAL